MENRPSPETPGNERDAIADAAGLARDRTVKAARYVADKVGATAARAGDGCAKAAQGVMGFIGKITLRQVLAVSVLAMFVPVLLAGTAIVSSEGLRALFALTATPLHILVPVLGTYRETRRLDLAVLLALTFVVVTFCVWHKVIRQYVRPSDTMRNTEKVCWFAGVGLLVCDLVIYWYGVRAGGSFMVAESTAAFSATVFTAMYGFTLLAVSHSIVELLHPERKPESCESPN
ncbi:MAG: hypothetical protein ACJ8C4_06755 [Gemmataceae bacterium]